jgi:hypothetical protein
LALLAILGCGTWDLAPRVVRADLPEVPHEATLDYLPQPGMAQAALPAFDAARGAFVGSGRIWIKGSAACRRAVLPEVGTAVALDPPYYTAVVEAPPGRRTVELAPGTPHARAVQVDVPDPARLAARERGFSALFFGDFQPFAVADGRTTVNPGPPCGEHSDLTTLVAARRMLRAAAEGLVPGFPAPAYACGIGDQVYVEGDYHSYPDLEEQHPMSAWTVEAQPRPRVALGQLPRFLDVCYRSHWSFTPLQRALQTCPSVMVWDDHDIRDGWGSQGDEHVYRDSYFRQFREACVAHQFSRGPRPWTDDLARVDAPLWQEFTVGGVPVFLMDLRTCRDVSVPQVIGAEQWHQLRRWFAALDPARSPDYVLVSTVPLFFRVGDRANIAASFTDEVRDDLLDTWNSAPNEAEWLQLLGEIAAAGRRGLRGVIVSGDYHINSLCRVTAEHGDGPARVIAYELIVAGLAADSYGDWKQQMVHEGWFMEAPIEVGPTRLTTEFGFVEPCPSFAGIEFAAGEVIASHFLADESGCSHLRVPLSWGAAGEAMDRLVARSRVPVAVSLLPE